MPETGLAMENAPGGVLILVVGPSGAGKDTLIDHARRRFADRPVAFPRRIVTRKASSAEAHDTLDAEDFSRAAARGEFAFRWQAHGLDYAIPAAVDALLARGDTVVCNVSRSVVGDLRARYPRICVILVDAPLSTRLGRIAGRRRSGEAPDRGRRDVPFGAGQADAVIDNGGDVEEAFRAFEAAISAAAATGS